MGKLHFQPTAHLRWALNPRDDVDPTLQQLWIADTGKTDGPYVVTKSEWRDIPRGEYTKRDE